MSQAREQTCAVDCVATFDDWGACSADGFQNRSVTVTQPYLNGASANQLESKKGDYVLRTIFSSEDERCERAEYVLGNKVVKIDEQEATTATDICTADVVLPRSDIDDALLAGGLEPGAFSCDILIADDTSNATRSLFDEVQHQGGLSCPAPTSVPERNYYFKVDHEHTPRVVTLCPSACDLIKNAAAEQRQKARFLSCSSPSLSLPP